MKEASPALVILIGFIILGIAYAPLKNASQNKDASGSDNPSSIQKSNNSFFGFGNQNSNQTEEDKIKNTEKEIKDLEKEVQKKIEESTRSPYHGKVTLSSISKPWDGDPSKEYIYLYTNLDKNEEVNITGWYFKSEVTGNFVFIGGASLLPFPFSKNESNVVLKNGDRAIITKGFSPIGISFRTNKCTGYFEENRTFYPNLSTECPRIDTTKLPRFSTNLDRNDECVDLLERLPRCKTVDSEYIRDLPDTVVRECKTYMQTQVNYNSCVAKHFSDTNFPGNEYRIFLNKFGPLWRDKREKVNLYDQNGLIVDTFTIDY